MMKELLKALKIIKSNNDRVEEIVEDLFKADELNKPAVEDAAVDAVNKFYFKKSNELRELMVAKLEAGQVQGSVQDIDEIIIELKDLNPGWE